MPFTVDALLIREFLFEDFCEECILHLLVMLNQSLPLFEKLLDSVTTLLHLILSRDFKCFGKFPLYLLSFLLALFSCEIEPTKLQRHVSPSIQQFVEVILLSLCGHLHSGNLIMQAFLLQGAVV